MEAVRPAHDAVHVHAMGAAETRHRGALDPHQLRAAEPRRDGIGLVAPAGDDPLGGERAHHAVDRAGTLVGRAQHRGQPYRLLVDREHRAERREPQRERVAHPADLRIVDHERPEAAQVVPVAGGDVVAVGHDGSLAWFPLPGAQSIAMLRRSWLCARRDKMRVICWLVLMAVLVACGAARADDAALERFAQSLTLRDVPGFVAAVTSLRQTGRLPQRYVTKDEAERLGWRRRHLCRVSPAAPSAATRSAIASAGCPRRADATGARPISISTAGGATRTACCGRPMD